MSRAHILDYTTYSPVIGPDACLAPDSAVVGRTRAGARLTLGPFATVRADGEHIVLGDDCFFGERSTVHIADGLLPSVVGDRVAVARYALVHACTLGDDVVLGEAAVVMDGAVVGPGAVIGPGTLVSPRKHLDGGWLYQGNPAQAVRQVSAEERQAAQHAVRSGMPHPLVSDAQLPLASPHWAPVRSAAGGAVGGMPRIDARSYVAPGALLAGDVRLASEVGIWFGCVLFAGGASIAVGKGSNVQDNSFLVTGAGRGDIRIGRNVTVGHNVRMGACTIGDDSLVGMGAELEDGVVVEHGGFVAARAYVKAGTVVKAGHIWAGRPARAFRPVSEAEQEIFRRGKEVYVGYTRDYRRF
ncbi:MAG: gamma carbonic anhydrase family protein [Rhodocyclaceae bacterium]|jgi:carbonic anhydrase/acetyltransferase-like protein (isoleucine patch superfamily)|nr:gamma carbonic anhydrase family protein [Rhodocyclaceae bacterium]